MLGTHLHHRRDAYIEIVLEARSEIFDKVPDRFNIREHIEQMEEIRAKLYNI